VPRSEQQNGLADRRGDGGNEHEYRHDNRHDSCHLIARVSISDDRHRYHSWPGRPESPEKTEGQHGIERRRQYAACRAQDVENEACIQDPLSPVGVGQRAVEELADAQAGEIERDDQRHLGRVGGQAECRSDVSERRKHDVDGDGVQCRESGDQRQELGLPDPIFARPGSVAHGLLLWRCGAVIGR
jgi:hypothetical protein